MSTDPNPRHHLPNRCPQCEGDNIRIDGWGGANSRVQFGSKWTGPGNPGYGLNCFACLDCGYVGFYLGAADVENLRTRPIGSNSPVRSNSRGCVGMLLAMTAIGVAGTVLVSQLFAG